MSFASPVPWPQTVVPSAAANEKAVPHPEDEDDDSDSSSDEPPTPAAAGPGTVAMENAPAPPQNQWEQQDAAPGTRGSEVWRQWARPRSRSVDRRWNERGGEGEWGQHRGQGRGWGESNGRDRWDWGSDQQKWRQEWGRGWGTGGGGDRWGASQGWKAVGGEAERGSWWSEQGPSDMAGWSTAARSWSQGAGPDRVEGAASTRAGAAASDSGTGAWTGAAAAALGASAVAGAAAAAMGPASGAKEGKEGVQGSEEQEAQQEGQDREAGEGDLRARLLYIGRCPPDIRDAQLRYHWRELGPDAIVRCNWEDKGGVFQGYGFVEFRTQDLAKQVCGRARALVRFVWAVVHREIDGWPYPPLVSGSAVADCPTAAVVHGLLNRGLLSVGLLLLCRPWSLRHRGERISLLPGNPKFDSQGREHISICCHSPGLQAAVLCSDGSGSSPKFWAVDWCSAAPPP